jgi:ligand-binding sensor domain-containing protein
MNHGTNLWLTRLYATLLLVMIQAPVSAAADGYAVFKSTDQGRSWARSDAGLPGTARINAFASLAETVFVGTDSGIFTSTNEARSWQSASDVAMTTGRVICLAALGRSVFAGTDGHGMLRSSDRGKTWGSNSSFSFRKVRCLLAHKDVIYAGTDEAGVFGSDQSGQTWTPLRTGFPTQAQVFALAILEGRLFAGLYSRGLYVWIERDQRWSKVDPVSPLALATAGGTLVVGHNPGGLYWSEDLGASWAKGIAAPVDAFTATFPDDRGALSNDAPIWELAGRDGLLLVGASAGIYYSDDRGRTWTRARAGLPSPGPGIAFLLEQSFILAGTQMGAAKVVQTSDSQPSRTIPIEEEQREASSGKH